MTPAVVIQTPEKPRISRYRPWIAPIGLGALAVVDVITHTTSWTTIGLAYLAVISALQARKIVRKLGQ